MSPSSGPVSAQAPATVTVSADPSRLSPGFQRGIGTYSFQSGNAVTMEVLLVVYPSKSTTSLSTGHAQPTCTPSALTLVSTALADNFANVAIGWPVSLDVQVADDCGNAVTDGPVSVSFSNGDPPLDMLSLQNGHWSGSWTPRNPGSALVTLTFTAQEQTFFGPISGTAQIKGSILTNSNVPVINNGGVVSEASHAASQPLAPGTGIVISGVRLSDQAAQTASAPWPTSVGGASAILGGQEIPMYSASSTEINAIIPYGIAANSYPLSVTKGAVYAIPVTIFIADAQPAIFTADGSGQGQGDIYDVSGSGARADSSAPASAGDMVTIYCMGLGAVVPAIDAGTITPMVGYVQTKNAVTLTIGGAPAQVAFAGLVPGFVGIYQVNAQVPGGLSGQVPVVMTVAGQSSLPVTMAVQ